jgi:hypothetical protein
MDMLATPWTPWDGNRNGVVVLIILQFGDMEVYRALCFGRCAEG